MTVARILVIEDNPDNLELMSYLLTSFGYVVRTAEDGAVGLALAQEWAPDVIVCDVQMPTIDGIGIVRALKRDPNRAQIPIVAVTAYAMVGDRDRMLGAGFDGYIAKPISPEAFVGQVEAYLPSGLRARHKTIRVKASAPCQPPQPQNVMRATVLVVDDTASNRELLRTILEPDSIVVLTATSLDEGLALIREALPDLVVTDIDLGNDSGYELLRLIKADPSIRQIPVALISASRRHPRHVPGAAAYLRWDTGPEALIAEIQACLRRAAETGQPA